jgi:hypothetical protein
VFFDFDSLNKYLGNQVFESIVNSNGIGVQRDLALVSTQLVGQKLVFLV